MSIKKQENKKQRGKQAQEINYYCDGADGDQGKP